MARNRNREDWGEAKRRCRLSNDELRMAREMGLNPRKLIKNIPSPSERWRLRSASGCASCIAGNALLDETGIGVAHHQVDVFLLEPGSDRYLGRLCDFGTCPKGKPECLVPGCGTALFLRRHAEFVFDPRSLDPTRCVLLFDRARSFGPPSLDRWSGDVPF